MNLRHLLMLPWMALSKDSRRPLAGLSTVLAAVIVLGAAFDDTGINASTLAVVPAAHIAALMDLLFWATVMSSSLLLLHTANHLRMPVLERDVHASLALYAGITIALPALALGALDGHLMLAFVEIALGAGLGVAYASLPAIVGVLVCFIPLLPESSLASWLPMPAQSVAGFLAWASPCTALLWLAIAVFWRSAARRDDGLDGIRKPILLALRSKAWYGHAAGQREETQTLRRRWRWLRSEASLHNSGPGRAVASLRVALGGWAMPQTLASRIRHVASLLITVALAAALVWLTAHDNRKPDGDISMALIYAGIASPLFAQIQTMKLQRLWASNRAELPLLALLPGLASRAEIKRSLLQACLLPSFGAQCLLLIASLGVAAWLQLGTVGWAMVTLDQLLGMGMLLAFTLATLGGLPMDGWGRKGFLLGAIFVISGSGGMAAMTVTSSTAARFVLLAMAVVWAALLAPLVNLAWRGWRAFQHRPHPFLPTAI